MKEKPSRRKERRAAAHGAGDIGSDGDEAGERVDFMKHTCSLTNSTLPFLRCVRYEALAFKSTFLMLSLVHCMALTVCLARDRLLAYEKHHTCMLTRLQTEKRQLKDTKS